ncbi:excinuclease ABC subunit UvrC [Patescibacteria group bacterium]|nr:excinuclease ABC subunit UvrC [Patescibacteria group bacterium]
MVANTNKKIQRIVGKLPSGPGIYKMIDSQDRVLYIGKAKDLKKRIQSYFRKGAKHTVRIENMLLKVENLKYVTTDSELEAVILEYNLIKELKPKYNIDLKDDKSFVYAQVTVGEDFPKIKIVRNPAKDGSSYFGPKTSAKKLKKTIEVLRDLFPVRDCDLGIRHISDREDYTSEVEVTKKTIKYPCLQHHINTCIAPCIGNCTKEDYDGMTRKVIAFLEGKTSGILDLLKEDMEIAVREKRFEDAARVRDKIQATTGVLERQKVSTPEDLNQDVVGCFVGSGKVFLNLFIVRGGRLIDSENFILDARDASEGDLPEVISSFMQNYYEKCGIKPDSVLVPVDLLEKGILEKYLKVKILTPKRGEKNDLVRLSSRNAENHYKQTMVQWEADKQYDPVKALAGLQKKVGLKKKIRRMEGYDISHLGGEFTSGSMVVMDKGEPKNKDYRYFKLRTVSGGDDYAALSEVLGRRLAYVFMPVPKGIKVRRGLKKDEKEIWKVIKKENLFQGEMVMKDFVVLEEKGKIVGVGRLTNNTKTQDTINSLWVSPKMRGKGLGHVLLYYLTKKSKAHRVYIGCLVSKAGFYEKFGFAQVKKVPDFMKEKHEECKRCYSGPIGVFVFDKKSDASFGKIPDLIVLDGGKGQLSAGEKVAKKFGCEVPILAMDKSGKKAWFKGKDLGLKADSQEFFLLQRLMDEAHRFSNKLREGRQVAGLTAS